GRRDPDPVARHKFQEVDFSDRLLAIGARVKERGKHSRASLSALHSPWMEAGSIHATRDYGCIRCKDLKFELNAEPATEFAGHTAVGNEAKFADHDKGFRFDDFRRGVAHEPKRKVDPVESVADRAPARTAHAWIDDVDTSVAALIVRHRDQHDRRH